MHNLQRHGSVGRALLLRPFLILRRAGGGRAGLAVTVCCSSQSRPFTPSLSAAWPRRPRSKSASRR